MSSTRLVTDGAGGHATRPELDQVRLWGDKADSRSAFEGGDRVDEDAPRG